MIIFIDESGDPGFKIEKGSSQYLIISLIIFEDWEETQKARDVIEEYRKSIRYPKSAEFKFNKTNRKVIIGLLKAIYNTNFRIRAIVVKKAKFNCSSKMSSLQIYKYLLALLLKDILKRDQKNTIYLDGIAEREFRRTVATSLRKYVGRKILKFKIIDSKSDDLIQLADVIVGSIARSYLYEKKDARVYKKIISEKIEKEWILKKSDLEPILK